VIFQAGGTADSYDSSLGIYEAQTPGYSAVISSNCTSTSSATVQLTSAQIKGYVATLSTGPSYSSGAKIIGPDTPASTNIDTSRIVTNPYIPTYTEIVPTGSGTVLPSGSTTIGVVGGASQLYYSSGITLTGAQTITVVGPSVIVVNGGLSMSGNSRIIITSTGSLQIHATGVIDIHKGIINETLLPKNLLIISSNTNDTNAIRDQDPFYGIIYTPNSNLEIDKGAPIYGCVIAKQVTFIKPTAIHYDISLRTTPLTGVDIPFMVTNWRETTGG
jgi:hypothetical protein